MSQVAAMLTRWWGIIAAILLFTYGPLAVQPLLNYAQSPQIIYNWLTDWGTVSVRPMDAPGLNHSVYNKFTGDYVDQLVRNASVDPKTGEAVDPLSGLLSLYTSSAVGRTYLEVSHLICIPPGVDPGVLA